MKETLTDLTIEKRTPGAETIDEGEKLVEEANEIINPAAKESSLQDLQQKIADTKKMDGFQIEKTRGEVEQIKSEKENQERKKEEQEKKKQFITLAIGAIIDDLKDRVGFKPNETLSEFQARKKEENSTFFGRFKNSLSASSEILQKLAALEYKKANATGGENIELIKTEATFSSKGTDKAIEAAYLSVYPDGDYKAYKKEIDKDASGRIGTQLERNKWQA